MRISLSVTNFSWSPSVADLADRLVEIARAADDGGLDTIWVADHLLQADPSSSWDAEMLEAYSTLAFLAGHTQRVRLGTMVTGVTFRPPALLIKAVTTLDVLSGGRAWLGLGAGYAEDAARAMGLSLPPTAERYECLDETLRLAAQMWAGDPSPFHGKHYQLEQPISSPPPLSQPRPPILIGGMGERKTLRLVAQYADACNLFDIPDEGATIRRKLAVLAQHCEDVGRDYGSVEKTLSSRLEPGETAEQFAARCERLAALGIDHVVLITTGPWTREAVDVLCAARHMVDASTA
jgi:F420-dependent oxidoreductase-like protein